MRHLKTIGLIASFLVLFSVSQAWAEEKTLEYPECDKIADVDRQNLCRATGDPSHGKKDVNRFTNKDHSWYYCSLIKKRDLQNLCLALVDSNKTKCDLIGSKKIEEECLSNF
ncbi:MAG: hypothetical protein NPINA01_00070 [Nitrospinaceae bacterium]|nr:MAG: hypothetical protein NPINA01_00070 [Nitrospinaceae bacterium]